MINFVSGRLSVLVAMVILFANYIAFLEIAKKSVPPVRRLAPLDALEEGVGRAVELGRPVHISTGYGGAEHAGGLGSRRGLDLLCGLTMIDYVSTLCAQRGAEIIATFANPELVPLAADLIKQSYIAENKFEDYKPENVRFISSRQYAYATGLLGIFQRENIAFNVMTGQFSGDALIVAEGASMAGAFQVGSGTNAYIITICDYTFIGEEFLAAAAYISGDEVQRGMLRGQDAFRIGIIVFAFIGIILRLMGVNTFIELLKM